MRENEIVKQIMKAQGETNAGLASKLSITQAALWDRLNNKKRKEIGLTVLCQILRMLDYKLVVMPRRTPIPKNSYQIQEDGEGQS